MRAKQKEHDFYRNYNKSKTSFRLYMDRIRRGVPKETAILKKTLKVTTKVLSEWRECTDCKEFKYWNEFAKMKAWYMWKTPNCKECRNKRHREIRLKEWYREKEKKYKKQYNNSERWRQLNASYYLYWKLCKNNREILKKLWEYKPRQYNKILNSKKDLICRLWLQDKFNCLITQSDIYDRWVL